jgi:cyclase
VSHNKWEVLTEGGRERTGIDVVEWAKQAVDLGAGEILLTSVDRDGTKRGFDTEIINQVSTSISIPVIASGGAGSIKDVKDAVINGGADAIAVASILHYDIESVKSIKNSLIDYAEVRL